MRKKRFGKGICIIVPAVMICTLAAGCGTERADLENAYSVYEMSEEYLSYGSEEDSSLEKGHLFAENLCVGGIENTADTPEGASTANTAAVFVLDDGNVAYAKNIYAKRYPASTTKILTAYLAIKYGDLDQVITVPQSVMDGLGDDSSLCNIEPGDQLTLRDLLYGLMLESGNDAANAIAEAVGGSKEAFVEMMNEEALALGATQSHFVNPHGLPDDDHYTTAYDLYLIFSAAIGEEEFVNIISTPSYTVNYVNSLGETVEAEWVNSNEFVAGTYASPSGVTVIGGKTGTTDSAGSCLVLYSTNEAGSPVISIVLKDDSHEDLYRSMSAILSAFAN